MMQKITCMVVDDDQVDLLTAVSFLEDYPFITITGQFDSPVKAMAAANQYPPDALFLDIDMPGINGLQLREKLLQIPACIFITSHPDYAVESFEMAALDFLVKPFSDDRFARTMERLKEFLSIRRKAALLDHTLAENTIFIKDGLTQVKLQLHEIIYLEALNNYTRVVTPAKKHTVLSTLGNLIKEKAFTNFIRIHRSYAVQRNYINKVSSGEVVVGNTVLPVGRSYKEALQFLK